MTHTWSNICQLSPRIGITTIDTTGCKQWAHFQLWFCQVCRRECYLPSWKVHETSPQLPGQRYVQNSTAPYTVWSFGRGSQEFIFILIKKDAKLAIEFTQPLGFFSLTKGTKKAKQLKAWEPALLRWTINSSSLCEIQQSLLKQRSKNTMVACLSHSLGLLQNDNYIRAWHICSF